MSDFTPEEIQRYQRHLSLPQFGPEAQRKLKAARVLVIGAGGLGCPVLQYLAAAGVGKLGVMDFDRVDASNLQRQILFTEADVGRSKAEVAAQRLRAMNRHIEVVEISTRLTAQNALGIFSEYDVIVDGSDNFATRYLVNDACILTNRPLVYGAIYTFQGQVSVFNFRGGPTYRCLFPEPPDPRDAPNCSEIGVVGVLPGLIGTLQATETIKILTGIGQPLSGTLLLVDVLSMKQQKVQFSRMPNAADITELKEIEYHCEVETAEVEREEIDCDEFRALLADSSVLQILDVREPWERVMGRIESIHVPMRHLMAPDFEINGSGLKPDQPLVIFCASGIRSLKAVRKFRDELGFSSARSLRGGIQAWAQSGGEIQRGSL